MTATATATTPDTVPTGGDTYPLTDAMRQALADVVAYCQGEEA